MSVFIERLKQVVEGAPQPIGFRLGTRAPSRLKMQLVCYIASDRPADPELLSSADAVLFDGIPAESAMQACTPANVPVGVRLPSAATDTAALSKMGVDFFVVTPSTPLSNTLDEGMSRILEVDSGVSDGQLRAANSLAINAVLLDYRPKGPSLTWEDLLSIQRVCGPLSRPLLTYLPQEINTDELQALASAGLAAVVYDSERTAGVKPAEIKKMIGQLKPPTPPRRSRITPMVPRVAPPEPEEQEDEEDDE